MSLAAYEPALRAGAFTLAIVAILYWEYRHPRIDLRFSRKIRSLNNLALFGTGILLVRFALPVGAVGLAATAEEHHWGLLGHIAWREWVELIVALLFLDLALYLQHVLFHALPVLWRLHRTHHADLELDATTGVRFHPLEIGVSMVYKLAIIAALGAPVLAVIIFETMLNALSLFNHANIKLPCTFDRCLRTLIVTPNMHRIHHCVYSEDANRNFGFNLALWDRLFGTYRASHTGSAIDPLIGVAEFRTERDLWIDRLIIQPFLRPTTSRVNKEAVSASCMAAPTPKNRTT